MIKPTYPKEKNSILQKERKATNMKISSMFLIVTASFLSTSISSVTPVTEDHARSQNLLAATTEMQKTNYFTFVMLIKMSPPDPRLEGNITFLMPNDRMLANMALKEGSVSNFLLRHSIPSPLLFDTLQQFPTGTTIPSSLPNCTMRISNNGRRNFVINNVKIISPNICVGGSSIRCHGIDGVLSESCTFGSNYSVPVPPCPNNSSDPSCNAPPPIPSPSAPSTDDNLSPPSWPDDPSPTVAIVGPHKSGSPHRLYYDGPSIFVPFLSLMFSLLGIYF